MLTDFPELKVVFDKLWKEKEVIVAKAKPFRDEYAKLHAESDPLEVKMREAAKKFRAIEQPRMAEIDQQLAAIAKAVGGKTMSESPSPEPEKVELSKANVGEFSIGK